MKDNSDKKKIIVCHQDCPCHRGARYDQIECKCDWFCGEDYNKELVGELILNRERFSVG